MSTTTQTAPVASPRHVNTGTSAPPPQPSRAGRSPSWKRRVIAFILAAAAAVWLGRFAWHAYHFESTDDAYVTGRLHQISPQLPGQVMEVLVDDNQFVRAGDVLLRIDPLEYQIAVQHAEAALTEARAKLQQANASAAQGESMLAIAQARADQSTADVAQNEADLGLAQRTLARTERLYTEGRVSTEAELDDARSSVASTQAKLDSAKASLASARATIGAANAAFASFKAQVDAANAGVTVAETNLREAKRQLSLTTIVAPTDGRIGNRHVEAGNRIQPGQALFALAEPETWIVANFKETQLANMHVGQTVSLTIDALPDTELEGTIESIAPASGAQYALLPPDNATGNFNKVVQRVPVKIALDSSSLERIGDRLRLGLSAIVDVRVH